MDAAARSEGGANCCMRGVRPENSSGLMGPTWPAAVAMAVAWCGGAVTPPPAGRSEPGKSAGKAAVAAAVAVGALSNTGVPNMSMCPPVLLLLLQPPTPALPMPA